MHRSPGITVGLAIAVLLALFDITLPFGGGGDGRPAAAAAVSLVLGVLTIVGVVLHWVGRRSGALIIIVTRILSVVVTLPTLIMGNVPTFDRLFAAAVVVLTIVAILTLVPAMKAWTGTPRRVS
jgi:hypothetical protein